MIKETNNISFVVSSPTTAVWLLELINSLSKKFRITVVANLSEEIGLKQSLPESVKLIHVPIIREINLYKDVKALFLLIVLFYKGDFLLVHSVTPKAGLLSMLASWITRVPIRIHTFTGQVWVTKKGSFKKLLKQIDSLISFLSTQILVDSNSQRDFLIKHKVIRSKNSLVIGKGSISGVNTGRFQRNIKRRNELRAELEISNTSIVLLFIGRLKIDKGINELRDAFINLKGKGLDISLWLVGPDEEDLGKDLEKIKGVSVIPYTNRPEDYMTAADILCLPSYREGFGNVIIEAASCGVPSIASNIYGITDAIVNDKTGILIEPKSTLALENAIKDLITNPDKLLSMGVKAQERTLKEFSQEKMTKKQIALYDELFSKI